MSEAATSKFDTYFATLDVRGVGKITRAQAAPLFDKSGLPEETLAEIWALADVTQDGLLNLPEFRTAMHLATTAAQGAPLPAGPLASQSLPATPRPSLLEVHPHLNPGHTRTNSGSAAANLIDQVWQLGDDDLARYDGYLGAIGADGGPVSGAQAKPLFEQSGQPAEVLADVWQLATSVECRGDGQLSVAEFRAAMHLITLAVQGYDLPPQLPPALARSAGCNRSASPTAAAVRPPPPAGPAMTEEARARYAAAFESAAAGAGFVDGEAAFAILSASGLPNEDLGAIWEVADGPSRDGRLDLGEWCVALALIEEKGGVVPSGAAPAAMPPRPAAVRRTPPARREPSGRSCSR